MFFQQLLTIGGLLVRTSEAQGLVITETSYSPLVLPIDLWSPKAVGERLQVSTKIVCGGICSAVEKTE